jgi:hypothetical protein
MRCLFLYNIGEHGAFFFWLVKLFPGALIMCLKPEQIICVFLSGEGPTSVISGRMSKPHILLYFSLLAVVAIESLAWRHLLRALSPTISALLSPYCAYEREREKKKSGRFRSVSMP